MGRISKKNLCGVYAFDAWSFKPKISSIFHFEHVNDVWIFYIVAFEFSYPFGFYRILLALSTYLEVLKIFWKIAVGIIKIQTQEGSSEKSDHGQI